MVTDLLARRRPENRAAFTLVELLVVIGIITILVGLLLPTLNKARRSAVQLTCQSNLRSIGQAYIMYVNDNKGSMLPGELRQTTPGGAEYTPKMYWYMALRPYVSKLSNTGDLNRTTAIWICPADDTRGGYASQGAVLLPRHGGGSGGILPAQEATGLLQYQGRSYAVNHHGTQGYFRSRTVPSNWLVKPSDYWIRSNKVRRHSETIIVTDYDWFRNQSNAYWLKPPFAPFGVAWATWEEALILTARRHPGDKINTLFLDGHVSAYSIKELRRDGSQERLWFRDYPNDWPGPGL
jgi:prepilin-type processing-associated H-X9-DG protein